MEGFKDAEREILLKRLLTVVGFSSLITFIGFISYYIYTTLNMAAGNDVGTLSFGIFSDFAQVLAHSIRGDAYTVHHSSYPAIALWIAAPFAWICGPILNNVDLTKPFLEVNPLIVSEPRFWIAFLLYFSICIGGMLALILTMNGFTKQERRLLAAIFLCSAPFLFTLIRGNMLMPVLIFSMLFLRLKDSPSRVKREIGLICLALAGAMKIYPLMLICTLLRNKRIFETIRVFIYTVMLFFLPTLVYDGGLSGFVSNIGKFLYGENNLIKPRNLSFSGMIYKLIFLVTLPFDVEPKAWWNIVGTAGAFVILAVCAVGALSAGDAARRMFFCAAAICLVTPVSYFYVLVFMFPAFIEAARTPNDCSRKELKFRYILYGFLFFTPLLVTSMYVLHGALILAAVIYEFVVLCRKREPIKFIKYFFTKEKKNQTGGNAG